jgi:hypothetical protein
MEGLVPLEISEPKDGTRAFLLSLSKRWFGGVIYDHDQELSIHGVEHPFVNGMSGSPILDASGRAIGVVRLKKHDYGRRTKASGLSARLVQKFVRGMSRKLPSCKLGSKQHLKI